MNIGHETQGRDGISSWCLVSDLPRSPFGPSRREVDWDEHLACLQLRNPLQTIPSLETINQSSWAFILEDGQRRLNMGWWRKASIRKRAMWHWLDWNQRAFEQSEVHWTLQDAADIGPSLAKGTGRTSLTSECTTDHGAFRSPSCFWLVVVGCGWLWLIAGACGRMSGARLSVIGYRLSVIGYRRRNPLTELNVKPVRSVRCFKRGAARLRIKPICKQRL